MDKNSSPFAKDDSLTVPLSHVPLSHFGDVRLSNNIGGGIYEKTFFR